MSLPFVSLCTPTFNRRPFIPMMIQCFLNQDYPKERMEWIIVDDGTDKIGDLVKDIKQVCYYPFDSKQSLGQKRNFCNSKAKGEFIIYVDDDDYYPAERVSHSVTKLLENPDYLIAGSSEMYVYYKELDKMYTFGPYGKNHATAATFAFRRQLLQKTQFEDSKSVGEEKDFLLNRSLPVLQLDPRKTILVFSHIHNSYSKKDLLDNSEPQFFKETYVQVSDFISDPTIYNFFMKKIDTLLSNYDPGNPKWKPDVLQQCEAIYQKRNEMKEKREKVEQYKKLVSSNSSDKTVREKYEKKINDLTLIISQLLEENERLKQNIKN